MYKCVCVYSVYSVCLRFEIKEEKKIEIDRKTSAAKKWDKNPRRYGRKWEEDTTSWHIQPLYGLAQWIKCCVWPLCTDESEIVYILTMIIKLVEVFENNNYGLCDYSIRNEMCAIGVCVYLNLYKHRTVSAITSQFTRISTIDWQLKAAFGHCIGLHLDSSGTHIHFPDFDFLIWYGKKKTTTTNK